SGVFDFSGVLRVGPAFERFQLGHFAGGPDQPEFFRPLLFVKDESIVVIGNAEGLARGDLRRTLVGGRRWEKNVEARSLSRDERAFVDDVEIAALRADE